MELWIRSQDKRTLLKANRIDVDDTDIICWDNDYRCSETYMGKYKTQKRALEVLDEIHENIEKIGKDEIITDENGIMSGIKHFGKVYEMPEE